MNKNICTDKFQIPEEIIYVIKTLKEKNYEAHLVGGCVRDLVLCRKPKDWDVTTNATPEEVIALFPKTFYENTYGTVGVVSEEATDETLKVIEVTPYRLESEYSDNRRPDSVTFSKNLEDDLKRRDFTINAIALDLDLETSTNGFYKGQVTDLYKGQEDLQAKIVRTVGEAHDRFTEDGLRILRAVRIATDIGFTINLETEEAIVKNSKLLKNIAKERIRVEFEKIIMSKEPLVGIFTCQRLGLLPYIIPELEQAIGVEQNKAHKYDVWEHLLRSLQCAADKDFPLEVRLSALLHDIGKPKSRRFSEEMKQWTFHGHEVVSERMTKKILEDLKFPNKVIEKVLSLVRWHMFFSDTELISLSAVRRMIQNVGKENIWDLMNMRICDRIGTGRPKESPYRLRKYKAMIEEAMHDPISVGMLKIDGQRLMEVTGETPGPRIGWLLNALLEEVLENPTLNTVEKMEEMAKAKAKMSDKELKEIGDSGKKKKEAVEGEKIKEIRDKYFVE